MSPTFWNNSATKYFVFIHLVYGSCFIGMFLTAGHMKGWDHVFNLQLIQGLITIYSVFPGIPTLLIPFLGWIADSSETQLKVDRHETLEA